MAEYNLDTIKIEIDAVTGDAASKINEVADALARLGKASPNMDGNLSVKVRKTGTEAHAASKKVNGLASALQSVGKALGRIAFYRVIRSVIKAITEAFKEGSENAYNFAKKYGDATKYIATAMDSISGAGFKMQNQLGAAWATLLAQIQPILIQIINLVTQAASAITQFLAAFGGKTTYLKATDYAKSWTDAAKAGGKAAKEWKNQLLGFDEINRLEEPAKGGGGGGSKKPSDYDNMFEESAIAQSIQDFVGKIKEAFKNGDWEGLGRLIGEKIDSIGKWIYESIKKIDFVRIGQNLAQFLNGAIGSIDFTVWGRLLIKKFTMAIDFFIGLITELDWGLIAKSIGDFLIGMLDEASDWLAGHDWEQIGLDLFDAVESAIEGIDFNALADSFFHFLGVAFMAVGGLVYGFFEKPIQGIKDYFKKKMEEAGGDAWEGFKQGIKDAWSNIKQWCKDHIVDPFIDGIKDYFGIHSPSSVMSDIGNNIIQGLWNGIEEKWNEFTSFLEGLWNGLKTWWDGLSLPAFHIPSPHFEWTYEQAGGLIAEALKFVGLPATIPHLNISWYAQGGFPDSGELFMARESGPELVGRMGGRNVVANNAQIISGISEGVYEAVVSAMGQSSGNSDRPIIINLDGKQIARTTTKYQLQTARATG